MLTLFHDYISPECALAVRRLQRLADEGLPVAFEGFEAVGVDVAVPVTVDVLAAIDRLTEAAEVEGVVLRRPRMLPPTALAHALGAVADRSGLGASWREVCYQAFWADGADLSDRAVLAALADQAGLDAHTAVSALDGGPALVEIRRQIGRHRREGVGGVPTILAQYGGLPGSRGGLGYAGTLVPGLLPEEDLRALAEL